MSPTFRKPCPVDGCKKTVGPGKLICFSCWRYVPRTLQRRLYAAWNDGDQTSDYPDAVAAVVAQVKAARA